MLHPGIVATNEQLARFPNSMQPEDSVAQMLVTIDKLSIEDNGAFIDYKGDPMPW
jgi:hypothetical protein